MSSLWRDLFEMQENESLRKSVQTDLETAWESQCKQDKRQRQRRRIQRRELQRRRLGRIHL